MGETYRARELAKHQNSARYALHWRPRYLAMFALTRSNIQSARAAKISVNTAPNHRKVDPEFDAQVLAAEEYFVQLLEDVTMKSAIEGDCEPVFWQGIPVGHIRKFDNRLRIEVLRALKPQTYKMPGSRATVNAGVQQNNTFICDAEKRAQLIEMRQESLRRLIEKKAKAIEVGG